MSSTYPPAAEIAFRRAARQNDGENGQGGAVTLDNQKEMFSIAFVRAVAATAGYNVYRQEVDDDSIDIGISARGPVGSVRSPKLDVQLKCTADGILSSDYLTYQIKLKNYDDLRQGDYQNPRILVVVTVPEDVADWLTQTDKRPVLSHCGYWVSLLGRPAVTSTSKKNPRVTVYMPRKQPFTVDQLKEIMAKIGRKEML